MNPLLIRGTESDFMVNTRERESDFIENYWKKIVNSLWMHEKDNCEHEVED